MMSVCGVLIVPDHIDTQFLRQLKALVTTETANGRRFIIIVSAHRSIYGSNS
jgi:hypothetical protein